MAKTVDSRLIALEREAGIGGPSCCYELFYQFDGGMILSNRTTPLCPHGRPFIRAKTIVIGGPPRDPDTIL